jgi:hypothetical protein
VLETDSFTVQAENASGSDTQALEIEVRAVSPVAVVAKTLGLGFGVDY